MREYTVNILPLLLGGLVPSEAYRREFPFMAEMRGAMSREGAIMPTPIYPETVASDGLFPQLHRLKDGRVLVFGETSLSLQGGGAISVYDAANNASLASIQAGGPWQIAEGEGSWYATNGVTTLFQSDASGVQGLSDKVYANSTVQASTIVEDHGRFVFGGMADDPWNSTWDSIFDELDSSDLTLDPGSMGMSRFVMWSSIGGGDFPLWLFYPNTYRSEWAPTADAVLERFQRNELGWAPTPFPGRVLKILPRGDQLVVYGEHGIAPLVRVGAGFGFGPLVRFGIAGRSAAAELSNGSHLMVGSDLNLYLWRPDAPWPSRLRFRDYLSSLGEISIVPIPNEDAALITDGEACYIFHDQERPTLAEMTQVVTSIVEDDDTYLAGATSSLDQSANLVTLPLAFRRQALKTLTWIRVGWESGVDLEDTTPMQVRVHAQMRAGSSWYTTPYRTLNKEGIAHIRAQGLRFRVELMCANQQQALINSAEVAYQADDRRYHRGPDASTTDTGGGDE